MVLSKAERRKLRSVIFRHLDGVVTSPCVQILHKRGMLPFLLEFDSIFLTELSSKFDANPGYLNVALHVFCAQGWMRQEIIENGIDVKFTLTPKGRIALKYGYTYQAASDIIPHAIKLDTYIKSGFEDAAWMTYKKCFHLHQSRWNLPDHGNKEEIIVFEQIACHLEGLLAAPLIVGLGIEGLFHNYFSVAPFKVEEYTPFREVFNDIFKFFSKLGWLEEQDEIFNFTAEGLFFAKRAGAYGVTVSYLPAFSKLEELIFGNPSIFWDRPANTPEIHVNRQMNVWGSGGAHSTYFKKIDEIVCEIFNKPIEMQPLGFLDMGCGNGAMIEHIFDVIWKKTNRGRMLDEYPLFIVGADFNQAALSATRATLLNADIWAKVVWADISDPKSLAEDLMEKYKIDLSDLLNVRSFLDHNRIFAHPLKLEETWESHSTGAFAFRGKRLSGSIVEQNLVEHFKKWEPYLHKFGLLLIELHTIDPHHASEHLGETAVPAYDATHGFSDQYIVELASFLKCAGIAGLKPIEEYSTSYPSEEMPIISINVLQSG